MRLDRARSTAAAAWERYRSTVLTGGTPAQRRWAFDQALAAERKLANLERADQERERRRKAAAAQHGAAAA